MLNLSLHDTHTLTHTRFLWSGKLKDIWRRLCCNLIWTELSRTPSPPPSASREALFRRHPGNKHTVTLPQQSEHRLLGPITQYVETPGSNITLYLQMMTRLDWQSDIGFLLERQWWIQPYRMVKITFKLFAFCSEGSWMPATPPSTVAFDIGLWPPGFIKRVDMLNMLDDSDWPWRRARWDHMHLYLRCSSGSSSYWGQNMQHDR